MADQFQTVWITRNGSCETLYNIYLEKPPDDYYLYSHALWRFPDLTVDPRFFKSIFPNLMLNPADGPVQVRIHGHKMSSDRMIEDMQAS